jgi:hypothetical protein
MTWDRKKGLCALLQRERLREEKRVGKRGEERRERRGSGREEASEFSGRGADGGWFFPESQSGMCVFSTGHPFPACGPLLPSNSGVIWRLQRTKVQYLVNI